MDLEWATGSICSLLYGNYMSRRGPGVFKGMLDFVEDFITPPHHIIITSPTHAPTHALPSLPVNPGTQIFHHDLYPSELHDTAASS